MKLKVFGVALAVAVAAFLYLRERPGQVQVGGPAPSFSLPAKNGGSVNLEALRGRAVLVNFWATWCPPCREEMPSLERLKTRLERSPFELLAVSVDEEGWPAIDRFLKKIPLTMTILLDPQGETASLYGASLLPESFLIDKTGVVVKRYVGPKDWDNPKIVSEIEKYVQGS